MKKHNPDYAKNKDADVIKHGTGQTNPNENWEIRKNITPEGNSSGWGFFLQKYPNITKISGVNEELLGSATDDKEGILSMLRQVAGLTNL